VILWNAGGRCNACLSHGHYHAHSYRREPTLFSGTDGRRHGIGREPHGLCRSIGRCALSERGDLVAGFYQILRIQRMQSSRRLPRQSESAAMAFELATIHPTALTETAVKWVDAIEAATNRNDLQYLTLLPLRYMVPGGLFRRRRAWCALCFEQWRSAGQIVYEPLIWSIQASANCQLHARPLDHTCSHCARTAKSAGRFFQAGILRTL